MEPEITRDNGESDQEVEITGFSVVLTATENNPSILNPDFLHYNGIVDASQQVEEPRISTPAYSQVTFQDGLTVKADSSRVIFEQIGEKLAIKAIICPEIAKRYVKKIPHVLYRAVGINPQGYRRLEGKAIERVSDSLRDKGTWMSFQDITPEIQLKAIYQYTGRRIILDIAEAKKSEADEISGFLFQANVHRDIGETDPQKRINKLLSMIDSWREDLSDFHVLVNKSFEGK